MSSSSFEAPTPLNSNGPIRHHDSSSRAIARRILTGVLIIVCGELQAQESDFPGRDWRRSNPASVGMDKVEIKKAIRYALSGGGAGMIIRHGRIVESWGNTDQRFDLKSTTKSIGVTSLGLAIEDGLMTLDDKAAKHHPSFGVPPLENANLAGEVTLRHLATQTAGFAKPGGFKKLLFKPGTAWHYSDGGPNWLAECITLAYRRDVQDLLFERIFTPIGIRKSDLQWRNHAYRERTLDGIARREFGSGIKANVNAMARIGLLYLNNGKWKDQQLIPRDFVNLCRTRLKGGEKLPEHFERTSRDKQWSNEYGDASAHYGLLWWNNADGTLKNVPRDAYWSWGLYESLIVVVPSLDLVIARAGKSWKRQPKGEHYDVLAPFFEPIVASIANKNSSEPKQTGDKAPYPRSKYITSINWSAPDEIVRLAHGSDNWPTTWADDDRLYTAYGDGWGFKPKTKQKLSLGLAKVEGSPPNLNTSNIRSNSGERTGDGRHGEKASGLVCVDGRIYMLIRNADNAQLIWSDDHAKTWNRPEWKFTTSFGCPTFVNFGRNYQGAQDEFVYVVSPDTDSAYKPADRFVMARVSRKLVTEKSEWQFYSGQNGERPIWTKDVSMRKSIFDHAGECYRSGMTYNPGIKRYIWCQTLPSSKDKRGPRFEGGFGIYESKQPWGPWSTIEFTRHWDVGPGESSHFPTKWMSPNGRTMHLLFSGDDCFSVRKATLSMSTE